MHADEGPVAADELFRSTSSPGARGRGVVSSPAGQHRASGPCMCGQGTPRSPPVVEPGRIRTRGDRHCNISVAIGRTRTRATTADISRYRARGYPVRASQGSRVSERVTQNTRASLGPKSGHLPDNPWSGIRIFEHLGVLLGYVRMRVLCATAIYRFCGELHVNRVYGPPSGPNPVTCRIIPGVGSAFLNILVSNLGTRG